MDEDVKSYLAEGSLFFLPYIIPEKSTANIKYLITSKMITPLIAVTRETTEMGITQNRIQMGNLDQLAYLFQTTEDNIIDYGLGFVVPCALILAAYMLEILGVATTLRIIRPPTNAPFDKKFDSYITKHMYTAQDLLKNSDQNHPVEAAQPIYQICKNKPFLRKNLYYRIGLAASEAVFADLCNLISFNNQTPA